MNNSHETSGEKFTQQSFIDLGVGYLAAGEAVRYLPLEELEATFPIRKEPSPHYQRIGNKLIVSEAAFQEFAEIIRDNRGDSGEHD